MTARRLVFIPSPEDIPEPRPSTSVIVLDTAWTPSAGARPDVVPLRQVVSAILEQRDLAHQSLEYLDAWARRAGMVQGLSMNGISHWFRAREELWHWLHERLLWRAVVDELAAGTHFAAIEAPEAETGLIDVARALAADGRFELLVRPAETLATEASVTPMASAIRPDRSWPRRAASWIRRSVGRRRPSPRAAEIARRSELLAARVDGWVRGRDSSHQARVLAVGLGARQAEWVGSRQRLVDPYLDPVLERLRADEVRGLMIGLGLDHRRDADWELIADRYDLIPQSLMRSRWQAQATPGPAPASVLSTGLTLADAPLDIAGADLAPAILREVHRLATGSLASVARQVPSIEAALRELQPGAVLLTNEGHRAHWLRAAQLTGIPTFSIQHGLLYGDHPGYAFAPHPARMIPTRMFVFGDFERRILLEHAGYRPEEVIVSGSPRLTPAAGADAPMAAEERRQVRRDLGVAEGDRMLVISTAPGLVRRFHMAHMTERLLGGPLPRIHLVFKQHPGEADEGPYQHLIDGLAAAGGYDAPPMTVVRDADLYRLLRAADAHLGLRSTVLTDAVAVGTSNLIAAVQPASDILGYVAAGVATPVSNIEDVRDALDHPRAPDPGARRAFLENHFRPGDAVGRIATVVAGTVQEERPANSGSNGTDADATPA